ncbi:hypothetical protein ACSU6B_23205 [Neobacillus sp. C211]|uniref:hypothetical protein n=1 Tax=unclassified Neobacillus TaxID=2675272 RepID=UPI003978A764
MALVNQVLRPQAIAFIRDFSPNDVTYIQDDPYTADTNNIVATGIAGGNPTLDLSFGKINGTFTGTQNINVKFVDPNWVGLHIEVYDNGSLKHTSAVSYNGYNNLVAKFPFDASLLTNKDGNGVLIRVIGHVYNGLTITSVNAVSWEAAFEETVTGPIGVNHALNGTVTATSGVTSNLTVIQAHHVLTGTIGAASTVSGALNVIQAHHELTGVIAVNSSVTAELNVIQAHHVLTGAIDVLSNVTAELAVMQAHHELNGSISVESSAAGSILNRLSSFEADISVVSEISADQILKMVDLEANIGANADILSPDLLVHMEIEGELQAVADVTAELARGLEIEPELIQVVSEVMANRLSALSELNGSINNQSNITAHLDLQGQVALTGRIASQSLIDSDLNQIMSLSGEISAHSEVVSQIRKGFGITGSLNAISSIDGSIKKLIRVSGSISAGSSLAGDFTGTGSGLSGVIVAVSSLDGDITRLLGLSGGIEAISDLVSELIVGGQMFALEGNIEAVSNLRVRAPINAFIEVDDPDYDGVEAVNDGMRLSHSISEGIGRHIEFHFEFVVDPYFLESVEFRVKGTPGEPFTLRAWNVSSNRWDLKNQAVYDGQLDSYVSLKIRDFDNFLDVNNRLKISMRSVEAFTSGTLTLSTDYAELRKSYFQQGVSS